MGKPDIDIRMRLRDAKRFQKDARDSGNALGHVSKNAQKARGLQSFAKALVGVGAGLGALAKAKQAVNTTTDLAKQTIGLSKSFDMDTGVASEWAAVAKVRGIEGKALSQSFGMLSKQQKAALTGNKASIKQFRELGIPMRELKRLSFDQLLNKVSDGLKRLPSAQARTNAGMKLFSRGWQTVLPLIRGGSDAMDEQLALARKYGATFGGKSIKSMEELIQAQREAQFASLGLSIAFGTLVAPALTKFIGKISEAVQWFQRLPKPVQKGAFVAGGLAAVLVLLGSTLSLMGPGLTLVAAAFGKFGLVVTAARKATQLASFWMSVMRSVYIAQTGVTNASNLAIMRHVIAQRIAALQARALALATKVLVAGQWLLNAALTANPIGLVIAGMVALAAGFVLAYRRVTWFRNAVNSVWSFVKKYWPLLIGALTMGLAPAVFLIVKNFGKIRSAASSAFRGITKIFKDVINGIIGIWNKLDFGINISVPGWVPEVGGKGFKVRDIFPDIPQLAAGGFVRSGQSGSWISGEAGAELNTMTPRGVMVQPLATATGSVIAGAVGGSGREIVIHTHTHLEGREVAHTVDRVVADAFARG